MTAPPTPDAAAARRFNGSIPVLAFHAVQDGRGPLRIDAGTFERVVAALSEAGATGITAAAAGRMLSGDLAPPAKPVAFTFDDGYRSVYTNAFPVLRAAGWPATVFPVTSALGGRNTWDGPGLDDLAILGREQVAELHGAGWEVGGHTHSHRPLQGASRAEVEEETARSDAVLTEITGTRPESFAYPYGRYDAAARSVAAERYLWCWTIGAQLARAGDAADALPRIEAWYLRRPIVVRHLHDRLGAGWLASRRAARRVRGWVPH